MKALAKRCSCCDSRITASKPCLPGIEFLAAIERAMVESWGFKMEAKIKPKSSKNDSKILFFLLAFSLEDGEKMVEKRFKNEAKKAKNHIRAGGGDPRQREMTQNNCYSLKPALNMLPHPS
jgi:hypothetical protein